MGLIADEQSAMAHVLETEGKARTWVAPGSAEKKHGPSIASCEVVFAPIGTKNGKINRFRGLRAVFTRGDVDGVQGAVPRETVPWHRED